MPRRDAKKFATLHRFGKKPKKKRKTKVDLSTVSGAGNSTAIASISIDTAPRASGDSAVTTLESIETTPGAAVSRLLASSSSAQKRRHGVETDLCPDSGARESTALASSSTSTEDAPLASSDSATSAVAFIESASGAADVAKAIASSSSESVPTSAKKLRLFESKTREPVCDDENVIVSMSMMNKLVSVFRCRDCDQPLTVTKNQSAMFGSASKLKVFCSACGNTITAVRTSPKTGTLHNGYDINRRLVVAATSIGIGFTQLRRFFALMNMPPPMHLKTWQLYQKTLHSGVHRAADRHLQEAAEQVRLMYLQLKISQPTPEGRLDIAVSFDGSWQKRGRTSHNGIAAVIEIYSGLVVDFVTLSNYCHGCELGPEPDTAQFEEWHRNHKKDCQKNVHCSSQAMEVEAALILWRRSEALHNFRYMEMLGDGDGKAHARVNAAKVYGEGVLVSKMDCVNHVTKRMGTALRNLVEKRKAQHAPIGGRGKLTDQRIAKLTSYYGKAIKEHPGDLDGMVNAVWASFFHTLSTDDDPHHDRCPASSPDRRSWCFHKRAQEDDRLPPTHPHPLPRDIAEALVPLYKRLGDPQLLQRCLAGKTQNSNECFHSLVWRLCPKERWAGLRTVDTSVAICIQRFNKGSSAHQDVLDELELLGELAVQNARKEDEERVKKAVRKSTKQAQARRARLEEAHRAERQRLMNQEGVLYSPGLD